MKLLGRSVLETAVVCQLVGAKMRQCGAKIGQCGAKIRQGGVKMGQCGDKMGQCGVKMVPMWRQDGPMWRQDGPLWAQRERTILDPPHDPSLLWWNHSNRPTFDMQLSIKCGILS